MVLEAYQGRGFGKQMLRFLMDRAPSVVHLSVDKDNTKAIRLYESHGFTEESETGSSLVMSWSRQSIELPVSFGEAFDKLSILRIKLVKIQDEKKRAAIQQEHDLVFAKLRPLFTETNMFHYETLRQINRDIWCMQDTFRDLENAAKAEGEEGIAAKRKRQELCDMIILYNDRRFRVKQKIDRLLNSRLKEQKGYAAKKVFVIPHVGLGDMLTSMGIFRYLSTLYDEVKVVGLKMYEKNLTSFVSDDPNITFHYIDNRFNVNITPDVTQGYDVVRLGEHGINSFICSELPFEFYDQVGIQRSAFWDYFHIPTYTSTRMLYRRLRDAGIQNYLFMHNTASMATEVFSVEDVERKLGVSRDTLLFVNPNKNMYEMGHPFYEIAEAMLHHPLVDYKGVIGNASHVVVTDSSFFCMAIQLDIASNQCYYISRLNNYYSHLYKEGNRFNPYHAWKQTFKQIKIPIPEDPVCLQKALCTRYQTNPESSHVFVTFANTFFMTPDRILNQAVELGVYNKLFAYNETHIPKFMEQHLDFIQQMPRGYGAWIWKSYIILKTLEQLPENHTLLYCDAGMYIHVGGKARYLEYLAMLEKEGTDILVFDLPAAYKAEQFVKRDVVMNYYPEFYETSHPYCYAGCMFIKNTPASRLCISEWACLCETYENLLNIPSTTYSEIPGYRGNDGDNGLFGLCVRKHKSIVHRLSPHDINVYHEDGSQNYACTDWSPLDNCPLQCRRMIPKH
jgi:hypothetical protein